MAILRRALRDHTPTQPTADDTRRPGWLRSSRRAVSTRTAMARGRRCSFGCHERQMSFPRCGPQRTFLRGSTGPNRLRFVSERSTYDLHSCGLLGGQPPSPSRADSRVIVTRHTCTASPSAPGAGVDTFNGSESTMTAKADFTDEEWDLLLEAPPSAGMIVVTAQRGGSLRETIAMAKAYVEARQQHGESELLDDIVSAKPERDTPTTTPPRSSSSTDWRTCATRSHSWSARRRPQRWTNTAGSSSPWRARWRRPIASTIKPSALPSKRPSTRSPPRWAKGRLGRQLEVRCRRQPDNAAEPAPRSRVSRSCARTTSPWKRSVWSSQSCSVPAAGGGTEMGQDQRAHAVSHRRFSGLWTEEW